MVQRYKFESKSQPAVHRCAIQQRCFQWFKGTNLKANHNMNWPLLFPCRAVSNGSKVQIWKQITTLDGSKIALFIAVSNGSKVQIWKQITTWMIQRWRSRSCFQWFKGTNLKANHNAMRHSTALRWAVSNGSKVQIWKQITTRISSVFFPFSLFPMVQRYKFESKSQH